MDDVNRVNRVFMVFVACGTGGAVLRGQKEHKPMSQHYSDETRAEDPYTLPDVEVFYMDQPTCDHCGRENKAARETCRFCGAILPEFAPGWYFWYCLPGCLPDSEPDGPYPTEEAALEAVREQNEE